MADDDITTPNGDIFSGEDQAALANLLFRRLGRNVTTFCNAWRRLFQNDVENDDIMKLIQAPERRYAAGNGRFLTYWEAGRAPCTGVRPCPSCAVSEDDRSDRD